jgi:hypothetical protein
MWPFSKITHWPHIDWDNWSTLSENERQRRVALRAEATKLAKRDLQKPVQHLLRDAHEEMLHPWPYETDEIAKKKDDGINGPFPGMTWTESRQVAQLGRVAGAQKAIAALLAITAFETKRASIILIWLTAALLALTLALVFLELRPHDSARNQNKIQSQQTVPAEQSAEQRQTPKLPASKGHP